MYFLIILTKPACKMNLSWYIVALFFGICHSEEPDIENLATKYHVSTDSQNWFQALINCKSAGMELASIPTSQVQKNLEKFLTQHGYDKGYWLSGINLGNEIYYWASTGKPVVYTKWLPNQPDNAKLTENKMRGENCIQWGIYDNSPNPAGWNDLFCGLKLPYICQETEYCNKTI